MLLLLAISCWQIFCSFCVVLDLLLVVFLLWWSCVLLLLSSLFGLWAWLLVLCPGYLPCWSFRLLQSCWVVLLLLCCTSGLRVSAVVFDLVLLPLLWAATVFSPCWALLDFVCGCGHFGAGLIVAAFFLHPFFFLLLQYFFFC